MLINQTDIAGLSDTDLRRLITRLQQLSPGRITLATRLAHALLQALRDRHRTLAAHALDLAEDADEGAQCEPGHDPVAEARHELSEGPLW